MRETRTLIVLALLIAVASVPGGMTQEPGGAASAAPKTDASAAAKQARFEVASIRLVPEKDLVTLKPGESSLSPSGAGLFTMHQVTLRYAIGFAFDVHFDRIAGGPEWISNQYYDISAKPEGDVGLSYKQLEPLLQQLLKERFHLAYHHVTQSRKGYALVVARGGPKVKPTKGGEWGFITTEGIQIPNISMQALALTVGHVIDQPVADQTGLQGNYDIRINYAPMDGSDSMYPSIFTAIEEQLGLKLEKATVPVEMFVIDHVDRVPTEN